MSSAIEPPSESADIDAARRAVADAAVDWFALGKRDDTALAAAVLAYLKVLPDDE